MSTANHCQECGAEIAAEGPPGLCGKCLLALALEQGQPVAGITSCDAAPEGAHPIPESMRGVPSSPRVPVPGTTVPVTFPLSEKPGDRIGRYKLLQRIGEGGFGVVYMAQQQEPVKRRVALKIIKLGMDTQQVVARFEIERQALALMDHPNIAKVLDAGATETGRPYFVMELVQGIKVTEYCDQNNLSTRERLRLFVPICRAIQHAHQKGIIHRDLKPSNILITLHDGVPVPKIIDFGIAKATQLELTEHTVFTQFGQFIGTPAYTSPEQAEMSGLDVDTRSDIYSLGVLLYELLTGTTPFDAKALVAAGLEEMRRTIREQEPLRPSTRLSALRAAELTTTAKRRGAEGTKLVRFVRGDLDWIVMKCLEKDRTRRYETASRFADDIENFLKSEPVSARPPSGLYRLQRMVRRNRVVFAAASVVALSIIAALIVSTLMYFREREVRRHSQQVAEFLQNMLRHVEPEVALGRDTQLLRELLDETVAQMGRALREQPELQADLCNTIGEVYRALGYPRRAKPMFDLATTLRLQTGGRRAALATSYDNLGTVLRDVGDLAQSEALERQALTLRRNLRPAQDSEVARSLNNLALTLSDEGRFAESEGLLRQALDLQRQLHGAESAEAVTPLNNLALTLREQGKFADAMSTLDEALRIMKRLQGNSAEVALMHGVRAFFLLDAGNPTEARQEAQQSLTRLREIYQEQPNPNLALGFYNLALVHDAQGDLTNAAAMHLQALAMRRQCEGDQNLEVAASLDNLGLVLRKQKRFSEAYPLVCDALAMRKKLLGNRHPAVAASLNDLALVLRDSGQVSDAEQNFAEALNIQHACYGLEHPQIATTLCNRARLFRDQDRLPEAETDARAALVMRQKLLGEQHPKVADAKAELEDILARERKASSKSTASP